ncbi:MAG: hypothetical protein AAF705_14425 [Bacteroidota bacterium]
MKPSFLFFKFLVLSAGLIALVSCQKSADYQSTQALFQAMKAKNDGNWFQHFTFKQHTIRFDEAGNQTDSTVWYEAVSYPYFFRIDRDIEQGIYTIYRNDSTYNFRQDTLVSAVDNPAVHLIFKGGLYFVSLEESLEKLKQYKYDIDTFRKDTFMDEPAYVIGQEENQFWLHAEDFYCMRRISTTDSGRKVDVIYADFKKVGNGWVEQKVTFMVNGKKRLDEFYFDIEEQNDINPNAYDPEQPYQWFLD